MKTDSQSPMPSAPGARILIVAAPYYADVVGMMVRGAQVALEEGGAAADVIEVPGAFELPTAIALHAAAGAAYEGYIALGCVVRGETSHYDYVCGESARALMELGVTHGLAIGYGILTVNGIEQARERANPERRDKGREAARACLALVALKRSLDAGA
jgi:6,7-dimethyl-8-ribityllumazine synthase